MASYTQVDPSALHMDTLVEIPHDFQVYDIATENGVPANAVVEIIATNPHPSFEWDLGVREDGSGLARLLTLNEAEDGGKSAVRYLTQVSAGGEIEIYGSINDSDAYYWIVAYWEGVTFTEQWANTVLGSKEDDVWFELPAARLSLQTDRVHLITVAHSDTGKNQVAGVRTTDSVLERSIDIMEAEDNGVQCADWYVHTDAGDGNIEVYTAQFDDHTFYNQGYFDSTIDFTEGWAEYIGDNQFGIWTDADLFTDEGVTKGRVVDFLVSHINQSTEVYAGLRKNGTGDNRRWQLREAEGSGNSCLGLSAQTDGSGVVEYFARGNGSGNSWVYSYYAGYFNVGTPSYFASPDESITLADSTEKSIDKPLVDAVTLSHFFSFLKLKFADINQALTFLSYLTTDLTSGGASLLLPEALTMYWYADGIWNKNIPAATLTILEYLDTGGLIQNILQTVALFSDMVRTSTIYRSPFQSISLIDYLPMGLYALIDQVISISHYLTYESEWYSTIVKQLDIEHYLGTDISTILSFLQTVTLLDYLDIQKLLDLLEQLTMVYFPSGQWAIDTPVAAFTLFSDVITDLSGALSELITQAIDIIDYDIVTVSTIFRSILKTLTLSDYRLSTYAQSVIDTLDATHYLSYISQTYRIIPEGITLSDFYQKLASLLRLETLSASDYIFKAIGTPRIDTLTVLDYTTLSASSVLSQAITLLSDADTAWTAYNDLVIESMTIGNFVDTITSLLVDLLQPIALSHYFSKISTSTMVIPEAITLLDFLLKSSTSLFVEPLDITHYLDIISAFQRVLPETLALSDYLYSLSSILISQSLSLLGFLDTDLTVGLLQQAILEVIVILDYILIGRFKTVIDTLTLSDTGPFHGIGTNLDLSLDVTEYLDYISTWYGTWLEELDIGSTLIPQLSGALQAIIGQTITLTDYLTRDSTFYRTIDDTLTLTGLLSNLLGLFQYDTFDISEFRTTLMSLFPTESMILIDFLSYLETNVLGLIQSVNIVGYLDNISTWERIYYNALDITSLFATAGTSYSTQLENIILSNYITKAYDMSNIDTLGLVDLFQLLPSVILLQILDISNYFTYMSQWYDTIVESITLFSDLEASLQAIGQKLLTETIGIIDSVVGSLISYRILSEMLRTRNVLAVTWDMFRDGASLTITDYLSNLPSILIYHILNITDYVAFATILARVFYETVTALDYLTKYVSMVRDQSVDITDYWSGSSVFYRVYNEIVTLSAYLSQLSSILIAEATTLTDYDPIFNMGHYLVESILLLDYISKFATQIMTESVTLSDFIELLSGLLLSQGITITDYTDYWSQWYRTWFEDIDLGSALIAQLSGALQQSIGQVIALTDYLTRTATFYRTIDNVLTLTDLLTKLSGLSFPYETLSVSDYSIKAMSMLYGETVVFADALLKSMTRPMIESLTLLDFILKGSTLDYYETIDISSYRTMIVSMFPVETLTLLEYVSYISGIFVNRIEPVNITEVYTYLTTWIRVIDEPSVLSDYLTRTSSQLRLFTEDMAALDYLTKLVGVFVEDSLAITDFMFNLSALFLYNAIDFNSLLTLLFSKVNIDVLTLTSDVGFSNIIYRTFLQSLTLLDELIVILQGEFTRLIIESINLSDSFLSITGQYRIFTEIMSMANILSLTWDILKDRASLTITDYLTYFTQWYRTDTGILSMVDYLTKTSSTVLYQLISLVDYIDTDLIIDLLTQSMIEALTLLDSMFKGIFTSNVDTLTFSTTLITQLSGYLTQSIGQAMALIDYLTYDSVWYRNMIDPLSLFSDLITEAAGLLQQAVTQSIAISDYLSKAASSSLIQDLDLSSILGYTSQFNRSPLEALALTDYYARTLITSLILPQGMTIIEYVSMSMAALRIQGITVSDILSNSIAKPIADVLNITDTYLLGISPYLTQSINIIDYVLPTLSGFYYETLYEIIVLSAELFKTASLYRTASYALSDYWDRQVDFTRVYTYDITLSGFLVSAWSTAVELVQGLLISDPYLRVIFLTLLQMAESMNILDFMEQMVPNVFKYITMYMKDTTVNVYTKKLTATMYTRATDVALYLKRIGQILYGKLRTTRR